MTFAPDWVTLAFQPLVIFWLPAYDHFTAHDDLAAPLLVTVTDAVKPVFHWFCTL
ncbi:hypothetical protein SGRIM128S_05413 [Streptomyces griseomycini]